MYVTHSLNHSLESLLSLIENFLICSKNMAKLLLPLIKNIETITLFGLSCQKKTVKTAEFTQPNETELLT